MDSPWKSISYALKCVRTRRHLYLSRRVTVRFTEDESRTIIHVESHRSRGFTWLLALFILKRGTAIWSRRWYSEGDAAVFVFVSSSLHNHRSRGRLILSFSLIPSSSHSRSPSRRDVRRRASPAIHPETEWKTERRQTAVA